MATRYNKLDEDSETAAFLASLAEHSHTNINILPSEKREKAYDNYMQTQGHNKIILNTSGRELSDVETSNIGREIRTKLNESRREAFKNGEYFFEDLEAEKQTKLTYSKHGLHDEWK